jgi:hypothetical protein
MMEGKRRNVKCEKMKVNFYDKNANLFKPENYEIYSTVNKVIKNVSQKIGNDRGEKRKSYIKKKIHFNDKN